MVAASLQRQHATLCFTDFYPLEAMLARVIAIATWLSVLPSVRLSVRHAPVLCHKKAVLPQGNRAMPQVFFSIEVRQQDSLQV